MKFNILAENIISSILEEGRKKKSEKFSYISVDGNTLKQKVESGELDDAINVTLAIISSQSCCRIPGKIHFF